MRLYFKLFKFKKYLLKFYNENIIVIVSSQHPYNNTIRVQLFGNN